MKRSWFKSIAKMLFAFAIALVLLVSQLPLNQISKVQAQEEATNIPTETLTENPTDTPTETPTKTPTEIPTEIPTETPTDITSPTAEPTQIIASETPTVGLEQTEDPTQKNEVLAMNSNLMSNGQFVYGPNIGDFSINDYINNNIPHLDEYSNDIYGRAERYSINPKIYMVLMEVLTGLVSNTTPDASEIQNPFGFSESGFINQLDAISDSLFDSYYFHLENYSGSAGSESTIPSIILKDGTKIDFSSNINASTYAIVSTLANISDFSSISGYIDKNNPRGFSRIFNDLFAPDDPLDESNQISIPSDVAALAALDESNQISILSDVYALAAPADLFQLPFPQGETWFFGGVHNSAGTSGSDMSSIDFSKGWPSWGADTSNMWVVAAASGFGTKISSCNFKITHSDGWETVYYHLDNIQLTTGSPIEKNQHIGIIANNHTQAICNGGSSTGPHVHFSLKYNGALVAIDGTALSGWMIHSGRYSYDTDPNYMWLERDGMKKYTSSGINNDSGTSPVEIPSIPTGIVASDGVFIDKVQVVWTTASRSNYYEVYRNISNDFAGSLLLGTPPISPFNDTSIAADIIYWYFIKACNSGGCSTFSTSDSGFSKVLPPAVPVLVNPASNTLITDYTPRLDWGNSSAPGVTIFDKYHIQVATDTLFENLVIDEDVLGGVVVSEFTPSANLDPNTKFYWRVNAWNQTGQYSAWSAVRYFRTAMLPPLLSEPVMGATPAMTRPMFDWGDVPSVTNYSLQISTYSNMTSPFISVTVTPTTYTLTSDLPQGKTLYWRVKANGTNPSAWSEVRSFTSANPPSAPTLLFPASNALTTDYTPRFDWGNSSVPTGTVFDKYHIQVASDSLFNDIRGEEDVFGVVTVSEFTPSTNLDSNTKFYWRVNAWNQTGQYSAWSAVRYFRTVIVPPTLLAPDDGINLLNKRPTFVWGDVAGATGYSIQISKNNSFTLLVSTTSVTASTYTPTSDLPASSTLYWRVQAKGANGPSFWSSPARSIVTANPPSIPTLALPASNALSTDYTPRFDWSNSTMPLGTIFAKYHLEVATDSNFNFKVIDEDVTGLVTNSEFTPLANLDPNTPYYWRVNAWNTLGQYSSWSAVRTFRTALLPPVLSTPTIGATPDMTRPVFVWGVVPGATNYTFQFSTYSTMSSPSVNVTVTSPPYTPTSDLPKGKTLYWHVKANGTNPSTWSEVWSFTSSNPPSTPTLLLPASNALTTDYTPRFDWGNSTIPLGTTFQKYHLEVATDSGFNSKVIDKDVTGLVTNSEFTPSTDFDPNTPYYWRVNAWNTAWQYSSWSAVRYFRTGLEKPTLTSPSNTEIVHSSNVTANWNIVSGATSYTFQFSYYSNFSTYTYATATTPTYLRTYTMNKTYYWRVRANGTNGPSLWSDVWSFSTAP